MALEKSPGGSSRDLALYLRQDTAGNSVSAYITELKLKRKFKSIDIDSLCEDILEETKYRNSDYNKSIISDRVYDIWWNKINKMNTERQLSILNIWDREGVLYVIKKLCGRYDIITVVMSNKLSEYDT